MSFIDEISGFLGVSEDFPSFKATLFGSIGVYFENVKEIKSFSSEKIELKIKKGEVTIEGEELCIKKYCRGDVAVSGKIKSLLLN